MPVKIDPPLTIWYCDVCDKPIVRNSEANTVDGKAANVPPEMTGNVVWASSPRLGSKTNADQVPERTLASVYKVVHQGKCDPDRGGPFWNTDNLLGTEGLQRWSELLWNGPHSDPYLFPVGTTLTPVLELMYRFQVPYYEQARRYLNTGAAQHLIGGRITLGDDGWRNVIVEGSQEVAGEY